MLVPWRPAFWNDAEVVGRRGHLYCQPGHRAYLLLAWLELVTGKGALRGCRQPWPCHSTLHPAPRSRWPLRPPRMRTLIRNISVLDLYYQSG